MSPRKLLGASLIVLSFLAAWIPYEVVYEPRGREPLVRTIGYDFAWDPPPVEIFCKRHFGIGAECVLRPVYRQIAFTAAFVFLAAFGGLLLIPRSSRKIDASGIKVSEESKGEKSSLVSALRAHFGKGFPISDGSATRSDPLVITSVLGYVQTEVDVVKFLAERRGLEFELESQALLEINGRYVDEIKIVMRKPDGAVADRETLYFDVSAGFSGH